MRLFCLICFVAVYSNLVWASERLENHSAGLPARVLVEALTGATFYGDAGGIKTQPGLALEVGAGMSLSRHLLIEVLGGYGLATTSKFDALFHGPQASVFLMAEPIHLFAVGVGARGGLDFLKSSYDGGWLSLDGKLMIGFISLFELGLQGGPRVALHKDKTHWGGELFVVGGLIF